MMLTREERVLGWTPTRNSVFMSERINSSKSTREKAATERQEVYLHKQRTLQLEKYVHY